MSLGKIVAGEQKVKGKNDGFIPHFHDPKDVCQAENGYLYVADCGNNVVRKITTSYLFVERIEEMLMTIMTLPVDLVKIILEYFGNAAGQTFTETIGSGKARLFDGRGKASAFCHPSSITCHKNLVFVLDQVNRKIRVIDTHTDNVTTIRDIEPKDWKVDAQALFINSSGHLIVPSGKKTENLEVKLRPAHGNKMKIFKIQEIAYSTLAKIIRGKKNNYFISGHCICSI